MAAPLSDPQLPLVATIHAVYRDNGRRIRALLVRALEANGISRTDMAEETGIDNSQLTRALDGEGANLPPAVLAYVLARDRLHVFVAGLAGMVGHDIVPRTPDLAAENRAYRQKLASLRAEIDELLEEGSR